VKVKVKVAKNLNFNLNYFLNGYEEVNRCPIYLKPLLNFLHHLMVN